MADELRGEAEVQIGGKTITLRANLGAIREMELLTKTGWQLLMKRALYAELFFDDIVAMVWSCGRASDKNAEGSLPDNFEELAELILTEGTSTITPALQNLCLLSAAGNKSTDEIKKTKPGAKAKLEKLKKLCTNNEVSFKRTSVL